MKPIALVAFFSSLGGMVAGMALRPVAADASTLTLYGPVAKGSTPGPVDVAFEFRDAKTDQLVATRSAKGVVKNGELIAEMPGLKESGLYAVTAVVPNAPPMITYVELQAASPGSQQTGHINVSGYVLAGRVGLGTSPTLARLQINEGGSLQGVRSITTDGTAVYGQSNATSGLGSGGYFTGSSTTGRAVVADQLSLTGNTVGGLFYSRSVNGIGVWGKPTAGGNGTTTIGVLGETLSANGVGVKGVTTANTQQTYGGWFECTQGLACGLMAKSTGGNAIQARNTSSSSVISVSSTSATGGRGVSVAVAGNAGTCFAGYVGNANTGIYYDGVAGIFKTIIASKPAVWGNGTGAGGSGVHGETAYSTAYGVLAENSGGGAKVALRALGNTQATGTKSFIMDHPLDPENQYLMHFSSEGPEPYNIYKGTATLDASGQAVVTLPAYFASINKDATVHLTPIGSAFQPYLVREVKNGKFEIAGGPNGGKVSWLVFGVRNDLYVQKYGYQTEPLKSTEEKGKYLSPELYGAKRERAINRSQVYYSGPAPVEPTEVERPAPPRN